MSANVARCGFVVVVAAAILVGASGAQAAFGVVNLSFTGVTGLTGTVNYYDKETNSSVTTGGIGIGKLLWNVNSSTDPFVSVGANFPTFCIELERVLSSPDTFKVGLVQNSPNPSTSSPFPSGSIGATREYYLGKLYDIAYTSLSTPTDFAAFQLAVWELSHETTNIFNVATGNGTFSLASGASALAVSTANTWLTALSGPSVPHVLSVYALSAAGNQDQIFAVPAPPGSSLPEATAAMTWGLMLLSVGIITNRLRATA